MIHLKQITVTQQLKPQNGGAVGVIQPQKNMQMSYTLANLGNQTISGHASSEIWTYKSV